MESKGMTAIVRGMPDSGLMVTVMDEGRQYTLTSQAELNQVGLNSREVFRNKSRQIPQPARQTDVVHGVMNANTADDRLVYNDKTELCQLHPSSPSVGLTEFPPQYVQLQPGRDHFQVGGLGSGSRPPARLIAHGTFVLPKRDLTSDSTRSKAFMESLRKYPSVSPDGSEVVQNIYSYSKENLSISGQSKYNGCLACYQTAASCKSRTYRKTVPRTRRSNKDYPLKGKGSANSCKSYGREKNSAKLECKNSSNVERIKKGMIIPVAPNKYKEVTCNTNQETEINIVVTDKEEGVYKEQNIKSVQTSKTHLDFPEAFCQSKKLRSLTWHNKICRNFKHEMCHSNETVTMELRNLKREIENLKRFLNVSKKDLNKEKRKIQCTNNVNICVSNESFLKNMPKRLSNFLRKILKHVFEIHRDEELLSSFQYGRNVSTMVRYNKNNNIAKKYAILKKSLNKNDFGEVKRLLFRLRNSRHAKKHYLCLNSLKRVLKNQTLPLLNNEKYKKYNFYELLNKNIETMYRISNNLKSIIPFQTRYVTNMLLNQYCIQKQAQIFSQQNTNTNIFVFKSLSDSYISLHNSSENKAILTQTKVDKINLQYSTKLLKSIKNKFSFQPNLNQLQCKNNLFDHSPTIPFNHEDYRRIKEDKQSTNRLSNIEKEAFYKDVYLNIEEKVNIWFSQFQNGSSHVTNSWNANISKGLIKDIAGQLTVLNFDVPPCTVNLESVIKRMKHLIWKHLQVLDNAGSLNLARKVSNLVQDVLNLWCVKDVHTITPTRISLDSFCSLNIGSKEPKKCLSITSKSFQTNVNILDDLYSKINFCNEDVRRTLLRHFSDEPEYSKNSVSGKLNKNQINYSQLPEICNKFGMSNVTVASANTCHISQNSNENVCRRLDKSNQTEKESASTTTNTEPQATSSKFNETNELSEVITEQQFHENNVAIFRNYCEQLPILAITPHLTELARTGVLHNLLKIFYTLQEDPDIANDYTYFEFCLEDEIDGLLDLLPQTEEMKSIREGWKIKLVIDAVKLLKFKHNSTDAPEFRQKLEQSANRRKLIQENKKENDEAQQLSALRTATEYLIFSNYHEQNPFIVKIYLQRLVDRINEIYDFLKKTRGISFLKLPLEQLRGIIFGELKDVPEPNNNITKEEIDLVNMNEEVEKWYFKLPVQQTDGINSGKRQILVQALAKKIHNIEKLLDLDEPSLERNIKHEISAFLSNKAAGLENDQDLNINLIVDDLTEKLRRKRHEKMINYESFKEELPFSSTFAQNCNTNDNRLPFSDENTLIDAKLQSDIQSQNKNTQRRSIILPTEDDVLKLQPIPRSTDKGVLGMSQIPGPSTADTFYGSKLTPRTQTVKEAPQAISMLTPRDQSPTKIMYNSKQYPEVSQLGQMTPTRNRYVNSNTRIRTPYTAQDQEDYSAFENTFRDANEDNNFMHYARQAQRMQSIGRPNGTTSTAQVETNYPGNEARDETDYRRTFLIEPRKTEDIYKMRCLCPESQMSPRRRFLCCCQDKISEYHCCLLPCDYFF